MRGSTLLAAMSVLLVALLSLAASATDAELYFSSDRNGASRVTWVQEGDSVFIVVVDNDENIDCDIRDKFWTDVKLMDPKTGANVDWESWENDADTDPFDYIGRNGSTTHGHFFEETGADTGVFVSNVAFQIGRRISWDIRRGNTHWVGFDFDGYSLENSFINGELGDWYYFAGGLRDVFNIEINPAYAPFVGVDPFPFPHPFGPLHGWFENMDTLVGLVQDPNDPSDVPIAMMKIVDTEASIFWDKTLYSDGNEAATLTVVDADENVSCSAVESVPIFILINPGSWNPVQTDSPTTFCMLWRVSGVFDINGNINYDGIWPHNIYDTGLAMIDLAADGSDQPNADGTYYIEYATAGDGNVTAFDTASATGITRVMFYAEETGPNTGVFEFRMNDLLLDLGFNSLRPRDVLAAYYLDPNDFDDFKVATAYIEERDHSVTMLTDASGELQTTFWLGRDPLYAQVIDANANVDPCCPEQAVVHLCTPHEEDDSEWWILDERTSNSSVFFSRMGMDLAPLWDAMGLGLPGAWGGYQMVLDNWRYEAFNEDDVLVRYNDVQYAAGELLLLGDSNDLTAFPPQIARARVANDVSFGMASIGDTQVFHGDATQMWFLDRQGNRVSEYTTSDCVFIEVLDPDQNEDTYRRERVDGFWAGFANAWPFAPEAQAGWDCGPGQGPIDGHTVNNHLGTLTIFNSWDGPKVYLLNPRNGWWASVDLLETAVDSGQFVSVLCVDLADPYECVPTLGAFPGDTIIAVYQDPSNHSDSAWISIRVGVGGGTATDGLTSVTQFVDADGNEVDSYTEGEPVYVLVTDLSHTADTELRGALVIDGATYDLITYGSRSDQFFSGAISLVATAGDSITATYTDPTDPTDVSSDSVPVIANELAVERFYGTPNPFEAHCTFGYVGTRIASTMSVSIYDI